MTNETSRLTLAVDSRQVRTAASDLDRFSAAGRKSETATKSVSSAFLSLKGALGGISAGLAARAIITAADGYKSLNARLQLVTKSATEFAAAQKSVFEISQRTRSSLEGTGDLFTALSRSSESLGATQTQIAQVVETIQQSFAVSGTSAAAAAGAVTQLNQAFASGVLRGEEFNSVNEQASILMDVLGRSLGKTRGELRQLAQEGKLTSDVVFKALLEGGDAVSKQFGQLPVTVGSATVQAANSLQKLIGVLDKTTGASSALAKAIGVVSREIDNLSESINRGGGSLEGYVDTAQRAVRNLPFIQLRGFLILLRRAIGGTSEVAKAAAALQLGGSNDPRQGRGFVDPADEKARLDFLAKYATGQERLNAEVKKYRDLLGFGFTAEDEQRIRSAFTPKKTETTKINEAERYTESLRNQLQATRDLSVVETVRADLEAGRLGKVTADQRQTLLSIAQQIDAANRLGSQLEAEQRQFEDYTNARKELAEEGRRIFEETRTPAEQLASQLSRLNTLLQEGSIDWDTYARATFDAQDAFDQTTKNAAEATKEVKSVAQELGFTFSSAFENAIVGGNKLRDVIKGLGQDILRILVRNNITNPLSQAIGSFNFGSLFSGATPLATGMSYVPFDNFPALLHQGERVVPAARNRGSSGAMKVEVINPPGRKLEASASTQQSPTGDILRIVLREVANDVAGGGQVSKAMQRTYGLNRSSGAPRNG